MQVWATYGRGKSAYTEAVKAIWTGRMAQATSRYADLAPVVPACCNACRTCTTTNVIGLVSTAAVGLGAALTGFVRKLRPLA